MALQRHIFVGSKAIKYPSTMQGIYSEVSEIIVNKY